MSKLTPIILAVIMLASTSLAALDWAELEEKKVTEADGRSGPDATVEILSPRQTVINSMTGEKQHTLDAGEDTDFELYVSNIGDTDVEELSITLTIYLDESGARGPVAKDSAGNDLSWTNGDVVCDDAFVCPWSTLASGDILNNGKYTFSYQGSPIVWAPDTGDYQIVVELNALGDSDPGNDEYTRFVSVVDWTDVIVDLSWDSGKEVESGDDNKFFTLSVSTGGSTSWSARSIVLDLQVTGTVSSATGDLDADGAADDLLGVNQITNIGTSGVVETFAHEEDQNNVTNGSRYVLDFEDSTEWYGQITPDSSSASGDYSISVNLVSYVVYGQLPDCEETVMANNTNGSIDPNETQTDITYLHFCEATFFSDANAATSEDELEGKIQTFHDIGIDVIYINQGYVMDENEMPISQPSMPGLTDGPLNPAWSSIQASVRHLGSSLSINYDWKVTFDIENTVTGASTSLDADSCTFGDGMEYTHMELGEDMGMGDAAPFGQACVMYNFAPGIYNVTATAMMVNATPGQTDMSARNDAASIYEISALNNRPTVSVLLQQEEGSIVMGENGFITLEADAYDADDETGATLSYVWDHPGRTSFNGTEDPSICNGIGQEFATCELVAENEGWTGVQTYSITVIDEFGSMAMDFINVFVWNQIVATATTASGIGIEYNLTYNGANPFTITTWADSETSYTKDLTEFGYAGDYNSVAVVDYEPSTTYLPEDVYEQDLSLTYNADDITPTGVFWRSTNGVWAQLDATINAVGSAGSISIDMGAGNQVLSQGEIVMMGGELQVIDIPGANPTDLTVEAQKGGSITASWGYAGNAVPGSDWLSMEICDSAMVCTTTQENTTLVAHSMSGQTDTTHGETYTYTLQVCNVGGCNPTIATDSATADKMVDGSPSATSMTVSNKADANAWTVSWQTTGDTSDVEGWMVCYADYAWSSSGEMPTSGCVDAGDATSADVSHPAGTGIKTYHFAAVPYDDKNNMENAVPGTDIALTHSSSVEDPCEVNPDGDECADIGGDGDGADSSEVPTWTWGVIIGLVVVAFVVGAFILSRGGDGDDGKDWDY